MNAMVEAYFTTDHESDLPGLHFYDGPAMSDKSQSDIYDLLELETRWLHLLQGS